MHNSPELRLGAANIPYVDSIKFLGLQWDPKLTWERHINMLRTDCTKLLGILRMITSQQWGSDPYCTLKIFQMYIRDKMDYGAPIYNSAAKATLNSLDTITRESLRIATGAYKTTPIETLHMLANEMQPQGKRDLLSLRYFYKIKGNIGNPAYSAIVPLLCRTLFQNKRVMAPLNLKVQDMIDKYQLRKRYV